MARRSRIAIGVASIAGAGALAWGGVAYAAGEGEPTPKYEIVTNKPADSSIADARTGDCPHDDRSGQPDGGMDDGL